MSVLTLRIPEGKHERLRNLVKARGISLNKLVDELSTVALAQHDAEVRFQAMASRGSRETGLKLLDRLDRAFARGAEAGRRQRGSPPAARVIGPPELVPRAVIGSTTAQDTCGCTSR